MKTLKTLLFVLLTSFVYSQFCPFLGPDQYLPCGTNSTTLTADLSQCGQGSNPNQTTNYTASQIPYAAQINNGTLVALGDDAQSNVFNIGFTFCFYGQTYTQFRIGSNGWISFGAGVQPVTFASLAIPTANAAVPKNCVMGPWQDWHPGIGGQIRYQTSGTAPCRKLTVSWIGVPMYSCTNLQGTFHIVIYESTNYIESYIANKPSCPQWAGGTAVQGIHNAAGTQAVPSPGRNSTVWTAVNNAWRWTPSGPVVTPTLTWYQVGNPVPIATGVNQITVTPPVQGANYTCRLEYGPCNAGWSICNAGAGLGPDTVFVQPGPPVLNQPNFVVTNPLCNGNCNGSITVNPTNGTPPIGYVWSNGQTTQTINNLCAGTYTVTLTDVNNCTVTANATLIDPPVLQLPLMTATNPVCFGYCDGTATANPIDGVAPYTYLWDNGQTNQTAINLCAGAYNVTVTDANGCPASNTITLTNPPMVVVGSITSLDTICYLSSNETYSVPSLGVGYSYNWSSVGPITSGQGTNNISVDWSTLPPGFIPGAVNVVAIDQNGCTSLPQVVDVYILNVLPTIDSIAPLCDYANCVTLTGSPIGGTFTGNGVNGNLFCPSPSIAGNNTITYTYIQSNCTFDTTRSITVYPRPTISQIQNDLGDLTTEFIELCEGDSIGRIYNATALGGGYVVWILNQDSITNPTLPITWNSFGTFTFSAVAYENGCVSYPVSFATTIQRCPEELIYIPNTFTPDGNEYNHVWQPVFTSGFDPADFHLTIYNRWGELVFKSYDSAVAWDGTYNNTVCQDGTYTWIIVYGDKNTDKETLIKGNITLIR
jgi:gliding motility-associated-like protein